MKPVVLPLFTGNKNRSRKSDREKLLEVKLRSSAVRTARMKTVATTLASAFAVVAVVFFLWRGGEWTVNRLFFLNEDFAIRRIDIQTDGVIPAEQIKRWANIGNGENLMKLDLHELRRDLELNPLIESVSMERVPPGTLRMSVVEREPIARVRWYHMDERRQRLVSDNFLISETGHVMVWKSLQEASEPNGVDLESLPILEGIRETELRPGRTLESGQAMAALRLIRRFGLSPMAGLVDLARIDVSFPRVLVVTTGAGQEVTLSVDDFDTQIRRWRIVQDAATRGGKSVAALDLSVANNLPVRWVESSTLPAPGKRSQKPSRYKKKHV